MVKLGKPSIVNYISKNTKLSKASSLKAINAFMSFVRDSLAAHREVRLIGFGEFLPRYHKARKGRNPQTGKPLEISARYIPMFKSGSSLKKAVNK